MGGEADTGVWPENADHDAGGCGWRTAFNLAGWLARTSSAMGHSITAIVGTHQVVARVRGMAGAPAPTELPYGLCIAPLGHEQIDKLTQLQSGEYLDGFRSLSDGLQAALLMAVGEDTLAYIETEYFGGSGSQAAAVFRDGAIVLRVVLPEGRKPAQSDDPINSALRMLGVSGTLNGDEFTAVGLDRFRDLEALGLEESYDD